MANLEGKVGRGSLKDSWDLYIEAYIVKRILIPCHVSYLFFKDKYNGEINLSKAGNLLIQNDA